MTLSEILEKIIQEEIITATFSQPKYKSQDYQKSRVSRIEERTTYYQFERFTKEQAFHENVQLDNFLQVLAQEAGDYKQVFIRTKQGEHGLRISKKGKVNHTESILSKEVQASGHNRKKQHILEEGKPVDFLVHLGLMDQNGKIKHKGYDKFKQINRYLEFIQDSLKHLPVEEPTIIDFGCGKSYLTFALYYYLVKIKGLKVTIIGLDLKKKVIEDLNILKDELGYDGLEFRVGDIAMFDYDKSIDMVISLHACNTATDYAIEKAIKWNAKVIMAVPCCHKEINGQINSKPMESVLGYGLLKERISALVTDGLRGEIMKACGYDVSIMEFIDMAHTPKNIMIRGYANGNPQPLGDEYLKTCKEYGLKPTLEGLIFPS